MLLISEYKFSDDEINLLEKYRDQSKDYRIKQRFIALIMLSMDIDIKNIAYLFGCSQKTIENWFKQYQKNGIDALTSFNYKPKKK